MGRDADGALNEHYCQWCYADGTYTYSDMDDLINVSVNQMVQQGFTEDQARSYLNQLLPGLEYWKRFEELNDNGRFEAFKKQLIEEINGLNIAGMPKLEKLNALVGRFVNLEYPLPGGMKAKFLEDQTTYLGNQLESENDDGRCATGNLFGNFLLQLLPSENQSCSRLVVKLRGDEETLLFSK